MSPAHEETDMADETRKPGEGEKKPGTPPNVRISGGDKKSETARIELSKAQPPPAIPEGELKEVSKEALSEFYKKSTIRIDTPKKSDTQRIREETQKIRDETQKIRDETQKILGETRRIDEDMTKRTTMRVELDSEEQKKKKETARLPISDIAKRSTAKIDVDEISEGEKDDVFKRKTIPVGVPTPPPTAPPTRPPTVTHRPKTTQFKSPAMASSAKSDTAALEAKKSETARIDLPPEAEERPVTRPKTIRIKRPDGTTARKQLTISRTEEASVPEVARVSGGADSEDVGALFSICAMAAALVSVVLVYVLLAQTVVTALPFPGKI
jgi:hypothetical protein